MGPFGCLSADTEFLTPTGWKRIDLWDEDLVAEYRLDTGGIQFRQPEQYVVLPCESFLHLKNQYGIDQLLSDEHTVLFNTRFKPDEWRTIQAGELAEKHNALKDGFSGRIPTTFKAPLTGSLTMSDAEIRLMVAVCADGSFSGSTTTRCALTVRKERKKARIRHLLRACGNEWEEYTNAVNRPTETTFRFYAPHRHKSLGAYWGASEQQLAVILDEAQHWDGCIDEYGGMIFSSCDKDSADLIQYAAATQGKRATVTAVDYDQCNWRTGYRVYVNTGATELSLRQAPKIERVPSEDGLKYCFTTSTGFFVARRNGRIFVTGNSGKSSGCCMEIVKRASQQRRGPDGYRRTRWAVVRNTAPQLRDTTIKTWLSWFPNGSIGHWQVSSKTYFIEAGDIRAEVMFRALDDAQDVKNLLSLELTGAWFNECREIPKEIVEAMDGRIPRFPAVKDGGQTWCGMWGDTNPPEEESYWYHIFEHLDPETGLLAPRDEWWDTFVQPSGLSPEAENLEWLEPDYYTKLAKGKTKDFIRVNVEGKYGRSKSGRAVHPTFDADIHVAKNLLIPNPHLPLIVAADFGLTPAMSLMQQNPFGQLLTYDEIVTENMGLDRAIKEKLKPLIRNKYDGYDIRITGDPSGENRSQTDEKTCVDIFKRNNFRRVKFAYSNDPVARVGALDSFLTRLTENGPAFLLDPRVHHLRRALAGGYHYPINTKGDVSPSPKKNLASHIAESAEYGAMYFERGADTQDVEKRVRRMVAQQRNYASAYNARN